MKFNDELIKKILIAGSYISKEDFDKAEKAALVKRTSLMDYLLVEGLLSNDILGQAMAESLKLPYVDLSFNVPSQEQILMIPEAAAKEMRAVVASIKKNQLVVATDSPEQKNLLEKLAKIFPDNKISLAFSLPDDINTVIAHYHKALETRFSKIIEGGVKVATEILGTIFSDAFDLRASDIHFEPYVDDVVLRFRIDGVLRDVGRFSKEIYENVLNRIKVQSGIRLDEHRAAQDGAMQYVVGDNVIDLRTSIVPTVEGEKVVLRLLGSYVQGLNLNELGFSDSNQEIIEQVAGKPFGMILVTGPTGSGKTTTLYALLKTINNSEVNVTTIEDPVEYKLRGVNQIQVNLATNLTFARGLRSIVRQDPDIILVGEIRDQETAEIAVNAALTGHLLLSTFHANDAATAMPRLLEMGIEPFLLASTLDLVLSQRLLRKICDSCRYSVTLTKDKLDKKYPTLSRYFTDKKYTLYEGKGCSVCSNSGYKGRTSIFEIIKVTPQMQSLILKQPSTLEIWKLAREQGSLTLFEDGLDKVKNGLTTIDELLRVAEPPESL